MYVCVCMYVRVIGPYLEPSRARHTVPCSVLMSPSRGKGAAR